MPLLDHFRPPLSERRHWHSFQHSWATYLSSHLNALLPTGYFAEANVQFGIEIDVATLQEADAALHGTESAQPARGPQASVPVDYPEGVVEIGVFSRSGGAIPGGGD